MNVSQIHSRNADEITAKSSKLKSSVKRLRYVKEFEVEKALIMWFKQIRSSEAAISTNLMIEKAKQFAVQLNKDFTPTSGWFWRLQKHIQLRNIHVEECCADGENAEIFSNTVLSNIIADYDQADIFNADESALFIYLFHQLEFHSIRLIQIIIYIIYIKLNIT